MNRKILGAGLGASLLLGLGTATAATPATTCHDHASSIERSVRMGEPIKPDLPHAAIPSLGGALTQPDPAAAIATTNRTDAGSTARERADAMEALAQARIYGAFGAEDACLIALHEAFRLLDQS